MAVQFVIICVRLIVVGIFVHTDAFNVDVRVPIVKRGASNSYFGYSVTIHRLVDTNISVLLVGAPRGGLKPGETVNMAPGMIYQCPLTSVTTDCQSLDINMKEVLSDPEYSEPEDFQDQWFGVTVASQMKLDGGLAIACAHRLKLLNKKMGYDWGHGICVKIQNDLDISSAEALNPCSYYVNKFQREQCQCQAGTSVDFSPDGDLLIGAPGSVAWRGSLHKIMYSGSILDDSEWYQSPALDVLQGSPKDQPPPATAFYSNLGMAVKIGHIFDPQIKTYVGGAPRSGDNGQVILFEETSRPPFTLTPRLYLTGDQFGSGFGYDVTIGDFNGDGRDDLIVGAPFFYSPGIGGAVYIYLNNGQGITSSSVPIRITSRTMRATECLELNCQNARFGFAIASVGDLDRDGFNDFVVGAPFEGRGAVYVYSGKEQLQSAAAVPGGLKYSQRIYAAEIQWASPALASFGHAFQNSPPGIDLDNNTYPDIVVGAYGTDQVVVLRTRPVVNVFSTLTSNPSAIDPKLTQCVGDSPPGPGHNCFDVRVCLRFTAQPAQRFQAPLKLSYRLEAEKFTGATIIRVFFKGQREDEFSIERNVTISAQGSANSTCFDHRIYVKKSIRDILTSVYFNLTYRLPTKPDPEMRSGQPLIDLNDYPVLRPHDAHILEVPFVKNCGAEDVCESELALNVTVLNLEANDNGVYTLKVGRDSEAAALTLDIAVVNNGEDAHAATVNISFPSTITFDGSNEQAKRYDCTASELNVICSIGNPLQPNGRASFNLRFRPSEQWNFDCLVTVTVNTTSTERDQSNNERSIKLNVVTEADLALFGRSDPSVVMFSRAVEGPLSPTTREQIGPAVQHIFEVRNVGVTNIPSGTLDIHWPFSLRGSQSQYLLYLVEPPEVKDDPLVWCDYDSSVINPLNLQNNIGFRQTRAATKRSNIADWTSPVSAGLSRRRRSPETILDCDSSRITCVTFKCHLHELAPDDNVVIVFSARFWNRTISQNFPDDSRILIHSTAKLNIDPNAQIIQTNVDNDVLKVVTEVVVDVSGDVEEPPWWIILLAMLAGLLLLVLIIFVLWKLEFFKRHRVTEYQADRVEATATQNDDDNKDKPQKLPETY